MYLWGECMDMSYVWYVWNNSKLRIQLAILREMLYIFYFRRTLCACLWLWILLNSLYEKLVFFSFCIFMLTCAHVCNKMQENTQKHLVNNSGYSPHKISSYILCHFNPNRERYMKYKRQFIYRIPQWNTLLASPQSGRKLEKCVNYMFLGYAIQMCLDLTFSMLWGRTIRSI